MNLEKFSKKSGKAIAKSYLNVVKFSKAFRIFVLAFLMLMCWWIFTTSIKATTVLAVCVILIVCNHLVVQNQVRQYNSMTYILTELLDAEKYLELCQLLNEKIKRTSGMPSTLPTPITGPVTLTRQRRLLKRLSSTATSRRLLLWMSSMTW